MGKTYYSLYDKIYSPLNLWWAYKDAARGKRYTPAVASFEYDLEKNLIEIEQDLKTETYELGGYRGVLRGGSWNNNDNNVRSANRNWRDPTNTNNIVSFRCSRLLPWLSSTRIRHFQGYAARVGEVSTGDSVR